MRQELMEKVGAMLATDVRRARLLKELQELDAAGVSQRRELYGMLMRNAALLDELDGALVRAQETGAQTFEVCVFHAMLDGTAYSDKDIKQFVQIVPEKRREVIDLAVAKKNGNGTGAGITEAAIALLLALDLCFCLDSEPAAHDSPRARLDEARVVLADLIGHKIP